MSYPPKEAFDAVTGDLRPAYRDAYLLGDLTPELARRIEAYLSKNPIQRSVLLGRYHELSAAATETGRTLVPPRWVQLQLQRQASFSAVGPWRRPVVRLASGVLLALSIASGVQWVRNKPLVPAPVAAAVVRAAASASQATQALVQRFSAPAPARAEALVKPKAKPKPAVRPQARRIAADLNAAPALAASGGTVPAAPLDSAQAPVPATPANANPAPEVGSRSPVPPLKELPMMQAVRGHISDAEGRPLPGATVLVPGTQLATTTDATGAYALTVPAGASLQFGYVGFADDVLRTSSSAISSTHNVVLTPETRPTELARPRRRKR